MKDVSHVLKVMVLALVAMGVSMAHAGSLSDLAKEQRWREQILSSLMLGQEVELQAGGVKFLALYAAPETKPVKGAVILIHGRGAHPAWPDVIEPLRVQLSELGWHTLSLQMPVLPNEAEDKDYVPLMPEVPLRIQTGVDYLKAKGIRKIILSGHSTGATMASYYLATSRDPAVKAFVIISGGPGVPDDVRMDSVRNFTKIKNVKILDLCGGEDRKHVLTTIARRQELARQYQANQYRIMKLRGADHFYRGKEDQLAKVIAAWLDKNIYYGETGGLQ